MRPHANGRRPNGEGERVLPHDTSAEASILGGIIISNAVLDQLDTLEVGAFYDSRHQVVFAAIRNLENKREPIDVVTLENEIAKAGKLEAIGGVAFLGELCLRVPTTDNILAYAKIVRDHHMLREVMLRASSIVEHGYNFTDDPSELLSETIADYQQLERGYREASERVPIITIGMAMEELDRLARTPVYETPFTELNVALGFGGLLSGQIYYLCGGTGFGKTSWVGAIVRHHAERGHHAVVAFWEMFAGYYCARMTAGILGCHSNEILRGRRPTSDVVRSLPSRIEFLDAPSMSTLKRYVDRHTRLGRPAPLIVVDYIQLLADQLMSQMVRPDPRTANALASAGLRQLAKDTGAAIVIVSGASRSTGKKLTQDVRKTPPRDLIDAARESGAIEYDGAGVIVLSVSDEKDGEESIATMTVSKARFGEAVHLDSRVDGCTGSWREIGRVVMVPKDLVASTKAVAASIVVREAIKRVLLQGPLDSKNALVKLVGKAKAAVLSEFDAMVDEGSAVYRDGKLALAGVGSKVGSGSQQTSIQEVS